jgi:hypothetical protein
MRLWSIHPKYLDAQGLVALWREGLLARKVLEGRTKGYRNHPQLERFRAARDPVAAIERYLAAVLDEATRRGYAFDASKIRRRRAGRAMTVTSGQLAFETQHLARKLASRCPGALRELRRGGRTEPHPLFAVVPGPVEAWERP